MADSSEFTFADAMALAPKRVQEAMVECGCGHTRAQHFDDTCRGKGSDLDPMYGVPPDEDCSCTRFDDGMEAVPR